ncbi:SLAP domain-containing protein [Lactobacillus helveticus]|uniref:SLAP domain-containing protein n=1 Tax=Lactobacillus helveticus TaxID=1587 RepID=UPI000D7CFC35|nr:SLAP domain-containing protein [Lactobacillus helveticus]MCT3409469.1 cell surface protein [Lactobacillus helveticus]PXZ19042.1 cell surface protein [Lactobacillus helveticus]
MIKNKIISASIAALMAVSPVLPLSSQAHTVQAADNSVRKTVMHNSIAYDKDGNSTGQKYYAYGSISVDPTPVTINGNQYYKISGKNQYVKVTNIDGVRRRVTHNAYIYRTSTQKTPYGMTASSKKWKLYKGEIVTTYGGYYTFKNGKHYFKVGGPRKQYVRTANLGPVIGTNTSGKYETTVTVTTPYTYLFTEVPGKIQVQRTNKRVKKGDKFVVDRLEQGTRAGTGQDGDDDNELAIYHIKGTDYWIYNNDVQAAKQLSVQSYNKTDKSLITMDQPVEVYNADGTSQNIRIKKNDSAWRVDSLSYIWVAKENKAELFYRLHLNGEYRSVYRLTNNGDYVSDRVPIKNAYIKASEVKVDPNGLKLTPSNTAAEAEAAAKK